MARTRFGGRDLTPSRILLIVAVICFVLAALGINLRLGRIDLVAVGLAFGFGSFLL